MMMVCNTKIGAVLFSLLCIAFFVNAAVVQRRSDRGGQLPKPFQIDNKLEKHEERADLNSSRVTAIGKYNVINVPTHCPGGFLPDKRGHCRIILTEPTIGQQP